MLPGHARATSSLTILGQEGQVLGTEGRAYLSVRGVQSLLDTGWGKHKFKDRPILW